MVESVQLLGRDKRVGRGRLPSQIRRQAGSVQIRDRALAVHPLACPQRPHIRQDRFPAGQVLVRQEWIEPYQPVVSLGRSRRMGNFLDLLDIRRDRYEHLEFPIAVAGKPGAAEFDPGNPAGATSAVHGLLQRPAGSPVLPAQP